jgi:F0F1-type ATP synthase assembly protein I
MAAKLRKKIILREISLVHFLLLATGKIFVGIGIGILITSYALPYSYPLIIIGVLILLPGFYNLFKLENFEESQLKKKLK